MWSSANKKNAGGHGRLRDSFWWARLGDHPRIARCVQRDGPCDPWQTDKYPRQGCGNAPTSDVVLSGSMREGELTMKTVGLIGAGHIGSQVARLALAHGYDVVISNSRGPESLPALVAGLGPGPVRRRPSMRPGRRHRRRLRAAEELPRGAGGAARGQDRHRHEQLLPSTGRPYPASSTTRRRPPPNCCRRTCPRRRS